MAVDNVAREYPNAPGHLLRGPADLRPPRELHPCFYGSYDWHSCVHQHWLLARLVRLDQAGAQTDAAIDHFAVQRDSGRAVGKRVGL